MLFIAVAGNPRLIRRAESWIDSGWSGVDASSVMAVDYVAEDMRNHHQNTASIGYAKEDDLFLPEFNIADSRYKVGADLDFLFTYRHHISNIDRCAEGFSTDDLYRIVQLNPQTNEELSDFNVELDGFNMLHRFGSYAVFKRLDRDRT
jgi:hypothetical protein